MLNLVDSFAATDLGLLRQENEDSFFLFVPGKDHLQQKGVLAIVADGVGGASGGKVASSIAVSVMPEHYYNSVAGEDTLSALEESLGAAHHEILRRAAQDPSIAGMATTCTAFLLLGEDGFFCHVGDSRVYLLRRGSLRQITEDHTLVNRLVRDGLLTVAAARKHPQRNIILKALGSDKELEPDAGKLCLEDNDIILLCSDGLHGLVSDGDIASTLDRLPLYEAGNSLIAQANQAGGHDNITVVLLRISAGEEPGKEPGKKITRPYRVLAQGD